MLIFAKDGVHRFASLNDTLVSRIGIISSYDYVPNYHKTFYMHHNTLFSFLSIHFPLGYLLHQLLLHVLFPCVCVFSLHFPFPLTCAFSRKVAISPMPKILLAIRSG